MASFNTDPNNTVEIMNSNFVSKLVSYVNWVLIKLATDSSIDHRGYNNSELPSKLDELFNSNEDLSTAITTVCEQLNLDEEFVDQVETFINLDEESSDDFYEVKTGLFAYVIEYIGLHQIESLHGDSRDKFEDIFF